MRSAKEAEMLGEVCCCTVIAVIIIIVLLKLMEETGHILVLQPERQQPAAAQPIVKEKEIIREIIMIRCQYCGTRYDEHLSNCPKCGGK